MQISRIEIRNYYRKCAGYLSLMNTIFVLVASCLAIYIADFDELDVDEGTGVVMLNGLYFIFVAGLIFTILSLIAGIVGVKSQSEGIFNFSRLIALLITALMFFSCITSVYVAVNDKIEWSGETRAMTILYVIVSVFSVAFGVATFLYSHNGTKYYDKNSRLAKDVPEIEADRSVRIQQGIVLLCAAVLNAAIAFLAFYFRNMIEYFDRTLVESNKGFSGFYMALFIVGLILAGVTVILSVLQFVQNRNELLTAGLIAVMGNAVYLIVFTVLSIVAVTQNFVKSQCPDISYIIFAFVLCCCSGWYLFEGARKSRKKKDKIAKMIK